MENKSTPLQHIEKIENHYHNHVDTEQIVHLLNHFHKHLLSIMADTSQIKQQVADLNAKVAELQTSVDNEQAQIQGLLDTNAQVVTDLNAKVAELQAIIDAGGTTTPEDLQAISDGIQTAMDQLATTKADLEGTVA